MFENELMELFNRFVLPPTREHLELLRYLLVLASLIHFPFIGIVIGSTMFSVVLNIQDKDKSDPTRARAAKVLMDMALPGWAALVVFGVLPLPVLWVIYGQWLVESSVNTMSLVPAGSGLVIVGLVVLMGYRRTLRPAGGNPLSGIGVGGLGLLTLLLGAYVFFGSITRFLDPEKWFTDHHAVRQLASWNVIWRYLLFIAASGSITGGAILFFCFRWPGRAPAMAAEDERFMKNLGAGAAIGGAAFFPVFGFLYLFTLPVVSRSLDVYLLGAAALVVLFIITVYAYLAILSPAPRFGVRAFVLFLVVFALMIIGDQVSLVSATREHIARLESAAEERELEIQSEREAEMAKAIIADPVRGEEVFKSVCMNCHRFDERLVGPPLNTVLPKYEGKMDDLVAFMQKPSKVDPDYPPMPAPGLPLVDVKSVAAYLLGYAADGENTGTVP